jgi:smad nuclear-interacting protein 1
MFGYPVKSSGDNSGPQGILAGAGSDSSRYTWGREEEWEKPQEQDTSDIPPEQKVKSNFGLTGALAKDERTGNVHNGVLLKYSEPLDAAKPNQLWRLYVFKDDALVETLHIHRLSMYLAGREDKVCNILLAHPSCSKQHAVLQFRVVIVDVNGDRVKVVKPYLMDLGSTNKSFLNGTAIDDARYYELREKDVIKFGSSTREYVLIREESVDAAGGGAAV